MSSINVLGENIPKVMSFNVGAFFFYPFVIPPLILLMEFSPMLSGFLLSFCLIAKFVYMPMVKLGKIDNKEWRQMIKDEGKKIPYHVRYPVIVDLENTKTSPFNYITENTPDGLVVMRYDSETDGFDYWSDFDIKYVNLETVSRKYVNTFNCGGIYKNRKSFLNNKLEKIKEQMEKEKEGQDAEGQDAGGQEAEGKDAEGQEAEGKDDVFIKRKNISAKKTTLTKSDYVCNHANKYIKKGKFNEERGKQPTKNGGMDMLSWSTWKKTI